MGVVICFRFKLLFISSLSLNGKLSGLYLLVINKLSHYNIYLYKYSNMIAA